MLQNALRLQKLIFFGTNFLCKCDQPILKKTKLADGKLEYFSVVQNRAESSSDPEILIESFSDEEDEVKKFESIVDSIGNEKVQDSPDLRSHHDAVEIRRLLRRKDELERKQKMEERYNERLQVSVPIKMILLCGALSLITDYGHLKAGRIVLTTDEGLLIEFSLATAATFFLSTFLLRFISQLHKLRRLQIVPAKVHVDSFHETSYID